MPINTGESYHTVRMLVLALVAIRFKAHVILGRIFADVASVISSRSMEICFLLVVSRAFARTEVI